MIPFVAPLAPHLATMRTAQGYRRPIRTVKTRHLNDNMELVEREKLVPAIHIIERCRTAEKSSNLPANIAAIAETDIFSQDDLEDDKNRKKPVLNKCRLMRSINRTNF